MTRKLFYFIALTLLGCLSTLLCGSVHAQTTSATVTGFVNDQSKAPVAGVKVDAINTDTNIHYSTTTNSDGNYTVPNLPPGNYKIEVEKSGFKSIAKPDVALHLQDVAAFNFVLAIGSISEVITVQGGGININTTDGTVSTLVDATTVANMPLNGRSLQDLYLLTPGTATASPQGGQGTLGKSGEISVNGQSVNSNYFTVDGVSANVGTSGSLAIGGGGLSGGLGTPTVSGSLPSATSIGTTQALVPIDDLQEFRVQSSSYSAEYGRTPGGQFSFETKSGTNQWHGDAFDYLRNDAVGAANNYFNNYIGVGLPVLQQNDFGGALGGPVRIPGVYNGKDKTFFFVNYEGLRAKLPEPGSTFLVPDLCLRGMATTADPCSGAVHPAETALLPLIKAYPLPNFQAEDGPVPGWGVAALNSAPSQTTSINSTNVRLDQVINDKMTVFFRFSDTNSNNIFPSPVYIANALPVVVRTYTAGANNIFSSRLSNELRFNYSSNHGIPSSYMVPITTTAFPSTPPTVAPTGGTPSTIINGTDNLVTFLNLPLPASAAVNMAIPHDSAKQSAANYLAKQWNIVDTVSYTIGAHQFKFGVDYRRPYDVATLPNPQAQYNFNNLSQVISGKFQAVTYTTNAPEYPLFKNFSTFAQDEWKATHRLTLSFGLRWEVDPPPGVTQGITPYTCLCNGGAANIANWTYIPGPGQPGGVPYYNTTWFNFSPRLGAAYQLRTDPGWETVVRGGFGVFFDTGQQANFVFGELGVSAVSRVTNPSGALTFPNPLPLPTVGAPTGPQVFVGGFDPHLQLPYTLQWNASIEQSLGRSQALTVTYVGAHASRLIEAPVYFNSNPTEFQLVTNGNPASGNGGTSDYDALQLQFQRRLSHNLTVLASYTWSHCIDYESLGSNFFAGTYQRGDCDVDVRQNFSAAFSYDLPNIHQNRILDAIVDHWGIDDRFTARTSMPVTLTGENFFNSAIGAPVNSYYDTVQGVPLYLYGSNCQQILNGLGEIVPTGQVCPGGRAIDPCAFALTAAESTALGIPQVPSGCQTVNSKTGKGPFFSSSVITSTISPRNEVRGFGEWQMNLAIRREFPIYERLKLQFRAEAFNIFNHTNFGFINTSNTAFGLATSTLNNSSAALSGTYQSGGPRLMQFALKLIF